MITPEELSRLDPHERAALMRALIALDHPPDPLADPRHRARRRRGLTFFLHHTVRIAWAQLGMEGPAPAFRKMRLFTLLEMEYREPGIGD